MRHVSMRQREALTFLLFVAPSVLGFVAFTAMPVVASLALSLTDYDMILAPRFVATANYRELLRDRLFYVALYNTSYLVFFAVPLSMALAFAQALLLSQGVRGLGVYRTAFFLPSIVPVVVSGTLLLYLLQPQWGPLNSFLRFIGVPTPGWLASARWAKPALVLLMLWQCGVPMIVYLGGLQDVPVELYESARIDGASLWDQIQDVTLPLMTPTIFFTLVMSVINTFQVFSIVYVVTDGMGGPANSTLVYLLYLYRQAYVFFRMGSASAMAWILFVIILTLTVIQFRSAPLWVYYEVER
ncbi:MAG: sugar ABC transporter permease [Anaerolineae bacterium]|nr:sugar ABC transporter permease [Anaerolineae bacterium]